MNNPINNWLQFTTFEQLIDLKDEWEGLYHSCESKSHYLEFEYIRRWYECFSAPDQIRIIRVINNGLVIGFLPLVMKSARGLNVLTSLTNYHCMHSGVLVRNGYDEAFTSTVAEIIHDRTTRWDVLRCEYIYSFTKYSALFELIQNKSKLAWESIDVPTYTIELNRSFQDYYCGLSAKTRKNNNNLKGQMSKIGLSRLVCYQGEEAIKRWPDLLRLEDSGWKGEKGSSLLRINEKYQNFYVGLIDLMAASNSIRLYFLELNGTAIAGGFGYVEDSVFHWWKAGYDQKYKELSPSNQLFIFIVEHIISTSPQIAKIHLFAGNYGYKHKYSKTDSSSTDLILYNRTMLGRLFFLISKLKKTIKRNHTASKLLLYVKSKFRSQ